MKDLYAQFIYALADLGETKLSETYKVDFIVKPNGEGSSAYIAKWDNLGDSYWMNSRHEWQKDCTSVVLNEESLPKIIAVLKKQKAYQ